MNIKKYIFDNIERDIILKLNKSIHVALVGLGPHAKRIYLNYFKRHKVFLDLVVDLESNRDSVREYLDINGFKRTKIFTIEDKFKDSRILPSILFKNLQAICKTLEITHLIISTEPKGHYMYLDFALKSNIHVLTDKPITVVKNMTSLKNIQLVREHYYQLLNLAEHSKAKCKIMCQRQYHKGYEYIKNLLNEIVKKYQIPITYIDIYHCDGNWEMAHDLDKENHPYKYGYGKLFHSGYHFIDLLSDLLKINNQLLDSKNIKYGEIYSNCFTPNDELVVFNKDDYFRIFSNQNIPSYYNQNNFNFDCFGEKNFYGLLKFTNFNHQTITTVNLNLLHYGFSRRGWIETNNFYKENGRIRHERINIHVGTLLNIQIHSYQSKEIKDRCENEYETGGLEHFDIDIYRNIDIIGGKPFERIKLADLYSKNETKNMLGFNELSRDVFLDAFFKKKKCRGDLRDQALAIEILYSCALGVHNHYHNKKKVEKIKVQNSYMLTIRDLQKFSNKINENKHKEILFHQSFEHESYTWGVFLNKIVNTDTFEVYLYLSDNEIMASLLLYKEFKTLFWAKMYYWKLYFLAKKSSLFKIKNVILKKQI